MKHKYLSIILLLALLTAAPSVVMATPLVDTGPGPVTGGGVDLYNIGGESQWLAAEFTLSQSSTIKSVEGWMYYRFISTNLPLNFVIYGDGGEIPGNRVFSNTFTLPTSASTPGWFGPSNLSWELAAGTYWVAFEAQPGFDGYMPFPSMTPLANEAIRWVREGIDTGYRNTDAIGADFGLGVRISDSNAVPLPGAVWLMGSGLLGLGAWRRFRKS